MLADLNTVVRPRFAPQGSSEAFARPATEARTRVAIHGEDLATVLLRFSNGARGSVRVGQVLPGHKNDLQLELNGRLASLRWQQEQANDLWIGHHNASNQIVTKDPALLRDVARRYVRLPAGHQQGWAHPVANVIRDAYTVIRDRAEISSAATLCTFAAATRTASIVEAMLASASAGGVWVEVPDPGDAPASVSKQP